MMKTLLLTTMLLFGMNVLAQKTNLDKLPEKERNEYLLKVAKETMLTYGPEWYKEGEEPEIGSNTISMGTDKGSFVYVVTWFNNPANREREWNEYSVGVGIYADTGEVRDISFGDGYGYPFYYMKPGTPMPPPHPYPYSGPDLSTRILRGEDVAI